MENGGQGGLPNMRWPREYRAVAVQQEVAQRAHALTLPPGSRCSSDRACPPARPPRTPLLLQQVNDAWQVCASLPGSPPLHWQPLGKRRGVLARAWLQDPPGRPGSRRERSQVVVRGFCCREIVCKWPRGDQATLKALIAYSKVSLSME